MPKGKIIVQVSDVRIIYRCGECNSKVNVDPYPQKFCSNCGVELDSRITEGD